MTPTPEPWTLTARWIFPADQPPLPGGTITIWKDRIRAVMAAGKQTADTDLGNVAILPGLVNAHTHLDLTDARGKIPPGPDFTQWLRGVIEHRRRQRAWEAALAVEDGLREILQFGTTLVGDISSDGASWDMLATSRTRAIVFREMLGLTAQKAEQALVEAHQWLLNRPTTLTCAAGLSPHAPYSVRSCLFMAASLAGAPIAVHLAETKEESALLERRSGPFVPFLKEVGTWDPDGLAKDTQHVIGWLTRLWPTLFVHGNYLPPEVPIPPHATIVYCPRTHAAFGHPPHPFREFLKRGVRVVLGTDSLASNPDLDILAEARFVAARHPDLPGETLLRMITLDGAIALGWGEVAGSLTPGKWADFVVLPLPDREEHDPHRLVFESAEKVERVMFRGEWTV